MPILGINGIYNGQHKRPRAKGAMRRGQSAKASTSTFREFPKRRNKQAVIHERAGLRENRDGPTLLSFLALT